MSIRDTGGRHTSGTQTLRRVSGGKSSTDQPIRVTVRGARVIFDVAEEPRVLTERSRGVAVIGPPAVREATLLRDIANVALETQKGYL